MNKKITLFVVIIILACIAIVCYMKSPVLQEEIAYYIEKDFSKENIYTDIEELSKRLDDEILNGAESFVVYLKDIDVNEINSINSSLNGIFGSGASYQQIGEVGNTYTKVKITVKRTTNYYALQAYLNNTPIPENEEKAKQLYNVLKTILDNKISEDMSDYQKEVVLHDYLVENCQYSSDTDQPAESDIYRAYGALVNHDAVCNGYAEALQLLFMCAGIESEFVIGTAGGIDHAWNLVKIDGKWYHLDATWNDPLPDQGKNAIHSYFNISDEIISQSHIWQKEKYPVATDMEYNYYKQENAYFYDFSTYKRVAYNEIVNKGKKRYEAVIENYIENEKDMQFIFKDNHRYKSVGWQTYKEGNYCVLVLEAK